MPDMLIPQNEFVEWVSEEPSVVPALLEGYKAAMSDMGNDLLTDFRPSRNNHIVNQDFSTCPRYFMGFHCLPQRHQFLLSCLYVFPKYRGENYAKHLLDTAKKMVRDQGFIQVSVEERKIPQLDSFYKKQEFISTDDIIQTGLGMAYRDYFWSGKRITLSRDGNIIGVRAHSAR
jgi:GNAT superfamily N-acetyltransferase